jgi:dihydropteroate synthase
MQQHPVYENVTTEVYDFLQRRIYEAESEGIKDIIIDPGFGFGKTIENNYQLLKSLHVFSRLSRPILAGISRKSMIYKLLGGTPETAMNGTTALHWECLRQGASILRVHDVKECVEVRTLFNHFDC